MMATVAFWILKAKPKRFDIAEQVRAGAVVEWQTKRPPRGWKPTDGVFLWQASPALEVRGYGTITEVARPDPDGTTRFSVRADAAPFEGPSLAELRRVAALNDASFTKAGAAGTVFGLTDDQATALAASLEDPGVEPWCQAVRAADEPDIAISIRQPYTEMILRGTKTAEYRSTRTTRRGRVLIYAARRPGMRSYWDAIGLEPGDLPTGLLVGTVDVMTCVPNEQWGFAYELSNPRRLAEPLAPQRHPQPRWFRPFD